MVVTLDSSFYSNVIERISIYPAFYSIDHHPTIHQVLAEYFDKDESNYSVWANANASRVSTLYIYLVDASDLPSIQVLTKNMSMMFPNIDELTFCFENQCEIVSFLLTMILLELRSIRVISAFTGDKKIYLFIPSPG